MNLKETLEKCPKAAEKYYQFIAQSLRNLQVLAEKEIPKNSDVEIPDIEDSFIKLYAESNLITGFRSLYDFFDGEEVFVSVYKDGTLWNCKVEVLNTIKYSEEGLATRFMTENAALIRGFNILEEKLNDGKNS
jgi:hypothetical protein